MPTTRKVCFSAPATVQGIKRLRFSARTQTTPRRYKIYIATKELREYLCRMERSERQPVPRVSFP